MNRPLSDGRGNITHRLRTGYEFVKTHDWMARVPLSQPPMVISQHRKRSDNRSLGRRRRHDAQIGVFTRV